MKAKIKKITFYLLGYKTHFTNRNVQYLDLNRVLPRLYGLFLSTVDAEKLLVLFRGLKIHAKSVHQ